MCSTRSSPVLVRAPSALDPWLARHLVCPAHRRPLRLEGDDLHCPEGDTYPVVDGVPVMVRRDVRQTLWVADESLDDGMPFALSPEKTARQQ